MRRTSRVTLDEGDAARGAEHQRAPFGDRRSHDAAQRLCGSASASARAFRRRFGWIKTVAGQAKTKLRGRDRVGWAFTFHNGDEAILKAKRDPSSTDGVFGLRPVFNGDARRCCASS